MHYPTDDGPNDEAATVILKKFISKTLENNEEVVKICILRNAVLSSTIRATQRKSFSFFKPLYVNFSGEDAIDAGGPTREFFRLLMGSVKGMGIFDGNWFVHDVGLLQEGKYELAGKTALMYKRKLALTYFMDLLGILGFDWFAEILNVLVLNGVT